MSFLNPGFLNRKWYFGFGEAGGINNGISSLVITTLMNYEQFLLSRTHRWDPGSLPFKKFSLWNIGINIYLKNIQAEWLGRNR
jgi:hypothetical protein